MNKVLLDKTNVNTLLDYIIDSEENHFQEYVAEMYNDEFDVCDDEQLDAVLNDTNINHIYKTAMLLQLELEQNQ